MKGTRIVIVKNGILKRLFQDCMNFQKNPSTSDFPDSPVVKIPHFHCKEHAVWSLVGKLESHMPHNVAKKASTYICTLLCNKTDPPEKTQPVSSPFTT